MDTGGSGTPQGANRLAKIYTLLAFSRAHTPTSSHIYLYLGAQVQLGTDRSSYINCDSRNPSRQEPTLIAQSKGSPRVQPSIRLLAVVSSSQGARVCRVATPFASIPRLQLDLRVWVGVSVDTSISAMLEKKSRLAGSLLCESNAKRHSSRSRFQGFVGETGRPSAGC